MADRIPTEEVERLVGFHRPVGALAADLLDARREIGRLREALQAIGNVDPVDAILDPTRPLRIAEAALTGSSEEAPRG